MDALPIGSGGVNGGEGSKVFTLEGLEENIQTAYDLVCSIKGEPALSTIVQRCDLCNAKCEYNRNI